jgi:NADPH-dependent 7-cyano-7-deazaguanine reductase QueF
MEIRDAIAELKCEMTGQKAQMVRLATPSFTANCFVYGYF